MRRWAVVVRCLGLDDRVRYSFVFVNARNRYAALLGLREVLPMNPDHCTEAGDLLPYTVVSFRQCRPSEENTVRASLLSLYRNAS